MLQPIKITEQAKIEIEQILSTKKIPQDYGLRVLVEGGAGCGGANFRLGFDKIKEGDMSYFVGNICIIYEKKQLLYLLGLEVDFEEREDERGFIFHQGQAK